MTYVTFDTWVLVRVRTWLFSDCALQSGAPNVLLVSHCCLCPVTLMHLPIDHLSVQLSLSTLCVAQKAGTVEIVFSSSALCVAFLRAVFFSFSPSHRFSLCESLLLLLPRLWLSASLIHPPGGCWEPLLSDALLFFFFVSYDKSASASPAPELSSEPEGAPGTARLPVAGGSILSLLRGLDSTGLLSGPLTWGIFRPCMQHWR